MSTFSELAVYVTDTEWNWMHGNVLTSSVLEIDLERAKVYAHLQKHVSYTDEWEDALLARGSLATLKTRSAREYLMRCIEPRFFSCVAILRCMERPLCVVQYYIRLLLDANAGSDNTLHEVWKQAICDGRRDVIHWLWVEYPVVSKLNITLMTSYANVIYRKQAWTVIWMCQRYMSVKERVCDEWSCFVAVITKQFKVLRWLRRGPFSCPWNQPKCLAEAEKHGYTKIAEWIRRQPV